MASSLSISSTITFSVAGGTGKMSPVKRVSCPALLMYTLSPSRERLYVSRPSSARTVRGSITIRERYAGSLYQRGGSPSIVHG